MAVEGADAVPTFILGREKENAKLVIKGIFKNKISKLRMIKT